MRRVNESVRQVLAEAAPGAEGSSNRARHRDRRRHGSRPDARHGLRQRPRLRPQAAFELVGLEAAHGVLQSRLARELRLKRTPQLTFEYDPTVERGVRMSRLIDELAPDDDDSDD